MFLLTVVFLFFKGLRAKSEVSILKLLPFVGDGTSSAAAPISFSLLSLKPGHLFLIVIFFTWMSNAGAAAGMMMQNERKTINDF